MKTFLFVLIAFLALIQLSLCDCPYGWTKQSGYTYCKKPKSYQFVEFFNVKVGEDSFKNAFNRCETQNTQGVVECERYGAFIFPKCAEGYTKSHESLLSKCEYKSVPSGYTYLARYMDQETKLITIAVEKI